MSEKSEETGGHILKVYEKIFARLDDLSMSQSELSRRTGISTSTINDWKKKKINPQADKLVVICKALGMSLAELLGEDGAESSGTDYSAEEKYLVECYRRSDNYVRKHMLRYMELIDKTETKETRTPQRKVAVIQDVDGNNIVVINDIIFKGKRSITWPDVEEYLRQYVGEFYSIAETGDIVYIGTDLPDEYAGSNYTKHIKGAVAKAKANAAQAIPEIIEIATSKTAEENKKEKHSRNAKNGWYRYDTRFALPVYDESGEVERYNVFSARLLIRHAASGKMYLYDVLEIKKETSKPCQV
jgi:transcriptional regulator with XRE-family HTH domain